MDVAEIAELLGRPSTDPLVEGTLHAFGIDDAPEIRTDDADTGGLIETDDWLVNREMGIEFGFEDEAAFLGLDASERGHGPMVLTQLYLYGLHEGVMPHPGRFPLGLEYTDSRSGVRKKLERFEGRRRSYVRDAWALDQFTLVVAYTDPGSAIRFLLCLLRQPPLSPIDHAIVKLPELSAILSVLGKPLNDRGFRGLFAPLGFDQRREDLVGGQHAQFRDAYGFDLGFRRSSSVERWTEAGVRGLAFAEITFFRERMLDARGWAGELPLGVRFDDSPDMLLAKVPAPPDDRFDAEFTGWMLWHLPQYSLQIHYSSMENFVLRVRIMAPGVWASYAAA